MDPSKESPGVDKEKISQEILARCEKDQEMRKRWSESGFNAEFYDAELDVENQEYIKKVVEQLGGWPKISEFGEDVPEALWVMVQHVPDTELQKEMVTAMQQLPAEEVIQKNVAKTIDRIRIREGKRQLYGTSFNIDNNTQVLTVDPIEDEEHIDERRAAMGMDSFAAQKERAFKSYQEHLDKLAAEK